MIKAAISPLGGYTNRGEACPPISQKCCASNEFVEFMSLIDALPRVKHKLQISRNINYCKFLEEAQMTIGV